MGANGADIADSVAKGKDEDLSALIHLRRLLKVADYTVVSEMTLRKALARLMQTPENRYAGLVRQVVKKAIRRQGLYARAQVPKGAGCARTRAISKEHKLRTMGDPEANQRLLLRFIRSMQNGFAPDDAPLTLSDGTGMSAARAVRRLKDESARPKSSLDEPNPDREPLLVSGENQATFLPALRGSNSVTSVSAPGEPELALHGEKAGKADDKKTRTSRHEKLAKELEAERPGQGREERRNVRKRNMERWRQHLGNRAFKAVGFHRMGYGEVEQWKLEEEKEFAKLFQRHGKDFRKISSRMQRKSVSDCVSYYYNVYKPHLAPDGAHERLDAESVLSVARKAAVCRDDAEDPGLFSSTNRLNLSLRLHFPSLPHSRLDSFLLSPRS